MCGPEKQRTKWKRRLANTIEQSGLGGVALYRYHNYSNALFFVLFRYFSDIIRLRAADTRQPDVSHRRVVTYHALKASFPQRHIRRKKLIPNRHSAVETAASVCLSVCLSGGRDLATAKAGWRWSVVLVPPGATNWRLICASVHEDCFVNRKTRRGCTAHASIAPAGDVISAYPPADAQRSALPTDQQDRNAS